MAIVAPSSSSSQAGKLSSTQPPLLQLDVLRRAYLRCEKARVPIAAVFPHAVGSIRGVEAHRHTVLALGSDSFGKLDERRWSKACRRQLEGLERAFHVRVSVRVSSGVIDDLFLNRCPQ